MPSHGAVVKLLFYPGIYTHCALRSSSEKHCVCRCACIVDFLFTIAQRVTLSYLNYLNSFLDPQPHTVGACVNFCRLCILRLIVQLLLSMPNADAHSSTGNGRCGSRVPALLKRPGLCDSFPSSPRRQHETVCSTLAQHPRSYKAVCTTSP